MIFYYTPIVVFFLICLYFLGYKRYLLITNASVLFAILYSIGLGMYFMNFDMNVWDSHYPSLIISKWSSVILYYLLLPVDVLCIGWYLWKRCKVVK